MKPALSPLTIRPEPLTAAAFAPFGDVICAAGDGVSANQGTATRFNHAAALCTLRPGAAPNLAVFRALPWTLPMPVQLLERHPHSTQMFVPMVVARYLVMVAPGGHDGGPDLAGLRCFLCAPGQAINYRAGVWHHPIVALDTAADFVMLAWEDGTAGDCEEHWLDRGVTVEPAP